MHRREPAGLLRGWSVVVHALVLVLLGAVLVVLALFAQVLARYLVLLQRRRRFQRRRRCCLAAAQAPSATAVGPLATPRLPRRLQPPVRPGGSRRPVRTRGSSPSAVGPPHHPRSPPPSWLQPRGDHRNARGIAAHVKAAEPLRRRACSSHGQRACPVDERAARESDRASSSCGGLPRGAHTPLYIYMASHDTGRAPKQAVSCKRPRFHRRRAGATTRGSLARAEPRKRSGACEASERTKEGAAPAARVGAGRGSDSLANDPRALASRGQGTSKQH
eukprot:scaffold3183_cov381-Prasinococcus_capsulatus_cf.AAC.17